jgi:hypothetical protein
MALVADAPGPAPPVEARAFEARIVAGRGGGALVEVPFSVREAYGTGAQVKVRARFDGHEYRGSLAPMGGGSHVLGIRQDIRRAIGKDIGDSVSVVLELDTEPRIVEPPPELAAALRDDERARELFGGLSHTHQREYAQWVAEAVRPATRDRRARKAIDMIRSGKTR